MSQVTTTNTHETGTFIVYDPSGRIERIYTTGFAWDLWTDKPIIYSLDYDVRDEQPWSSQEISYLQQQSSGLLLKSLKTVMDDGSTFEHEVFYFGALANIQVPYRILTRSTAPNGSLDQVNDTYLVLDARAGLIDSAGNIRVDYKSKSADYDAATGQLDFVRIALWDGMRADTDHDPATGEALFVATYDIHDTPRLSQLYTRGKLDFTRLDKPDGTRVDTDFDTTTGEIRFVAVYSPEGRTLGQLYTGGELDYETETFPDGRIVATDHDLADEHPWSWLKVVYVSAYVTESFSFG